MSKGVPGTPVCKGKREGSLMRGAQLVLLSLFVTCPVRGQEKTITDVPRATVQTVGSGVFVVPQGQSIYVEEHNNRILIAFPEKRANASRGAYRPGPLGKREPCSGLAVDEFELVMSGESICVQMGWTIDTIRSIGDGVLARTHNGGCSIDIVRFEKRDASLYLIGRAECSELRPR